MHKTFYKNFTLLAIEIKSRVTFYLIKITLIATLVSPTDYTCYQFHPIPKISQNYSMSDELFAVIISCFNIHAINGPRSQLSRKSQAIERIESTRMQSEILQFALCHLFRSFPADLVPPWLLSGCG